MSRTKTAAQRREEHLQMLQLVEQPHPFWSLLVCLSFFAWIAGALGFIFHGLDDELHLIGKPALRWASVFVIGLALWVVSLLLA